MPTVWFGFVGIRPFRCDPLQRHGMKEIGRVGQNGCRPGDLSAAVWDANPWRYAGEGPQATGGHLSGGGSKTATYAVADSHQARVNEGRDRGTRTDSREDKKRPVASDPKSSVPTPNTDGGLSTTLVLIRNGACK